MSVDYKQYRRSQIAELADWEPGFDMESVSISDADKQAGSPKHGDKIARNPANHADKWLVAADYFAANFEPIDAALKAAQPEEMPSTADDEATRWRHGEPSAISDERIDDVMTQAQVFASSWAIVGSRFDNGDGYKDAEEAKDDLRTMIIALLSERPGWVSEWQPIETAAKLRKVLVAYKNGAGNWRRVIACYYPPETLESEYEESGWSEEGWYEESETHEEIRRTDCEPTHWMPLPAAPKETK